MLRRLSLQKKQNPSPRTRRPNRRSHRRRASRAAHSQSTSERCGCVLRLFRTSYILKPTQNFSRVAVYMLEHMLSHKSRGLVSGANKAASTRPRMRIGGSMTKSVMRNKRPAGGRVPHEVGHTTVEKRK